MVQRFQIGADRRLYGRAGSGQPWDIPAPGWLFAGWDPVPEGQEA
jgi:hypothetical protein